MKQALWEFVQIVLVILIIYIMANLHLHFRGGDLTNSLVTVLVGWFAILVVDVKDMKNRLGM